MKFSQVLYNAQQGHRVFTDAWTHAKPLLLAGHRLIVEVKTETRSLAQNRRMWAMLRDLSAQVDWHGQKLTDEEWKDVLTASLKKQKAVPGIDGGFVVLGARTSAMTIQEMTELQDLISAFGTQQGVKFIACEMEEP